MVKQRSVLGAHNLLMVKVRALEILTLRTTRKNPTKDRTTGFQSGGDDRAVERHILK